MGRVVIVLRCRIPGPREVPQRRMPWLWVKLVVGGQGHDRLGVIRERQVLGEETRKFVLHAAGVDEHAPAGFVWVEKRVVLVDGTARSAMLAWKSSAQRLTMTDKSDPRSSKALESAYKAISPSSEDVQVRSTVTEARTSAHIGLCIDVEAGVPRLKLIQTLTSKQSAPRRAVGWSLQLGQAKRRGGRRMKRHIQV